MKQCHNILTKKILKRPSHEVCEFCEETFSNKYDFTIHYASHIIIPLIRLKLQQCEKCLYFYSSKEELLNHVSKAHTEIDKKENIPISKEPYLNSTPEKTIKERVKYENDLSLHLLNDLTTDCKVTVETLFSSDDIKDINTDSILPIKSEYSSDILKDMTTDCKVKLESFPPEFVKDITNCNVPDNPGYSSAVLRDITTDCKVAVETFPSGVIKDISTSSKVTIEPISYPEENMVNTQIKDEVINIEDSDSDEVEQHERVIGNVSNQVSFADRCTIMEDMLVIRPRQSKADNQSVPYHNLMETGVFKCQHCDKSFSNRFDTIKHETYHIAFKRSTPQICLVCDKYIAGSSQILMKHITNNHPLTNLKKYQKRLCDMCRLPYRKYSHHIKYYHPLHCYKCFKKFENIDNKQTHMIEHFTSCQTLQICNLCMSFYKNKINLKYTVMAKKHVLGERQTCSSCGKMYFEINMVKRHIYRSNIVYCRNEKKKLITNEERLKNIQHRLKMMKVYLVVSFLTSHKRSFSIINLSLS